MPRSFSSPVILTLLTLLPILLPNQSFRSSVHAQSFRPLPDYNVCSGFVEGQGLYIAGGHGEDTNHVAQTFVLDLSVSWNTNDPVFRKLQDGSIAVGAACTMANNGEDLFALSEATVYVYNVRSDSWTTFSSDKIPAKEIDGSAAADPETGLVYIPTFDDRFRSFDRNNNSVLEVDIRAKTVNTIILPTVDVRSFAVAAWSTPLKSMVALQYGIFDPQTFAPSEINSLKKGWGTIISKDHDQWFGGWECMVPANGGSKMVLLASEYKGYDPVVEYGAIYVFDMVKHTWKRPVTTTFWSNACAITGDQFIVWGGRNDNKTFTNATLVFNVKTEKWVTSYIAPPRPSTTATKISNISQLPPTSTQHTPFSTNSPNLNDTSSSDKKLVTIAVIITGVCLAIIVTAIFVYRRSLKRSKVDTINTSPDGSSSDSLNSQGHINISETAYPKGSSRRHNPNSTGVSPDPYTQRRWYSSNLLSWLYRGPNGVRPPLEHPHAIVEDPERRNVQEGAVESQFPAHHPHAMLGHGSATMYNDKAEWESVRSYNNKEELRAS
ncbi:MAG: hypothetical protein J3Q66DRAFT_389059 [Benniella sp.]|nr:MAG: hypothetical protein J3Q66DRAFT_389059 [Benniella sp.]